MSAAQRRVAAAQEDAADAESAARNRIAKAEAAVAEADAEAAAALAKVGGWSHALVTRTPQRLSSIIGVLTKSIRIHTS